MILVVCPNPSVDTFVYVNDFQSGKANRANKEVSFPGGKGVHVALAIAELDEEVSLLGFWGGTEGEWIIQQCTSKYGIQCYGPYVNSSSRRCITLKTNNEFDETELLGVGPVISKTDFNNYLSTYKLLLKETDLIVFSGSWSKGVSDDSYAQLAQIATSKNIPVIVDASGEQLKNVLNENIHGIHLNTTESKELNGINNPIEQTKSLSKKVNISAITAGKDGLYIAANKEVLHGNVKIDNVMSAVGSGDCLTAGIAVAFKNNYSTENMARLSVACGAANCLRSELGMIYKKDVDKLFNEVIITKY